MIDLFTRHPQSMNETYFQHLRCASLFGLKMLVGGVFCLIHAVFPFLFQKTGSNILFGMIHDYVDRSPGKEERLACLSEAIDEKCKQ